MSRKSSLFFGLIEISSRFVINYKPKIPIKIKCTSSAFYAQKKTVKTTIIICFIRFRSVMPDNPTQQRRKHMAH